ncbi:MAG: hypothetical protein AVDCRST_MAG87-2366 [uncultured Thermomicrobiales bacterium]|uniref:Major facilitator superfamily (MFS) profile domain-containing protein n=1 Tax=uncultured Thermomicrobiales bacterium TaxID=1645740 RepID=A0A6J4V8Y5_9BACT|nr:MAG: hypothetical protein AVDCRST_MAG87-2366 [uncultured Thermomicrobiales bacterium]
MKTEAAINGAPREQGEHDAARREMAHGWRHSGERIRAGYFWYYAAIGTFMPFAALYYRELGFGGLQVGALTALPAVGMALSGPVWGAVADARAIHRRILRVALTLGVIAALATSQASGFPAVFSLVALLALASVPIAPLLDSYGMTLGDRFGLSYGRLRVWGSLGYMALTLALGRLMGDGVSSLLLVAHAACLGLALVSVFGLPRLAERRPRALFGGLREIRRNTPLLVLLGIAYLMSSGAAVMYVFLGIHIEDLDGTTSLVGPAFAISAASELPIVAFGGWFLSRIGAPRLIALALLVYAVRFAAFSVVPAGIWILPVQALHGLSYGAFLMASVTLAHRLAGRDQAATAQGLLTAMSFGFGSITGSLVGGALLEPIGTVGLFRGAAVLMLLTLAVLAAGIRLVGLDQPRPAAPA